MPGGGRSRCADVVLFPELWQLGYTSLNAEPARRAEWLAHATTVDGPFVSRFRELARELGLAVVMTYLEDWPGAPRNTATLIDRHGDPVLTYAKVHTCDFGMEAALTPGDGFRVADLDTRAGTVRVGLMICNDREFPESARVLMLGGAELILTPNACGAGGRSARAVPRPCVRERRSASRWPTTPRRTRPWTTATWARSTSATGTRSRSAASSSTARRNALDHKLVEGGEGRSS